MRCHDGGCVCIHGEVIDDFSCIDLYKNDSLLKGDSK